MYYRLSGRINPRKLIPVLLIISGGELFMGWLYSYLTFNVKIAWIFAYVLVLVGSYFLGLCWSFAIVWGQVRSRLWGVLISGSSGFIWWWIAWIFYAYNISNSAYPGAKPVWKWFISPLELWDLMGMIYANGMWSFNHFTFKGGLLGGMWGIELLTMMGVPIWFAYCMLEHRIFCEFCQEWGTVKTLVNVRPTKVLYQKIKPEMELKNIQFITTLDESVSWENIFVALTLEGCPKCQTTQTFCADEIRFTRNWRGKQVTIFKPLIKRLWLTPQEVLKLTEAVEVVTQKAKMEDA